MWKPSLTRILTCRRLAVPPLPLQRFPRCQVATTATRWKLFKDDNDTEIVEADFRPKPASQKTVPLPSSSAPAPPTDPTTSLVGESATIASTSESSHSAPPPPFPASVDTNTLPGIVATESISGNDQEEEETESTNPEETSVSPFDEVAEQAMENLDMVAERKKALNDFFAYGETPEEKYGRIIDCARLLAERLYERNGAVVGALAEAGGDEGAADRWLRGFCRILQPYWPEWWNDTHEEEMWKLAHNRRKRHFINKCLDVKELENRIGIDSFFELDMVALEVESTLMHSVLEKEGTEANDDEATTNDDEPKTPMQLQIEKREKVLRDTGESMVDPEAKGPSEEQEGEEDDDETGFTPVLSEDDIAEAKTLWGDETVGEIFRKTPEELQQEAETSQLMVESEKGNWWGPATEEAPGEAYRRLIDAARRGVMMAYERRQDFIGGIADAVDASPYSPHSEEAKDDETKEKVYNPDEIGFHAREHFEQFLKVTKEQKALPPWWNDDHEASLWRIAEDKNAYNFLSTPLDGDELKAIYGTAAAPKVSMLAEAAAAEDLWGEDADLNDDGNDGYGDDMDDETFQKYLSELKEGVDEEWSDDEESGSSTDNDEPGSSNESGRENDDGSSSDEDDPSSDTEAKEKVPSPE